MSRVVEVVRTYLTLDSLAALRPGRDVDAAARIERRDPCSVGEYRRLYRDVGQQWYWHDRLDWSDQELEAHLVKPEVAVWVLVVGDASAGYFELQRHDGGSVEVLYVGLTAEFIGQGLGGMLLTAAVKEAFAMGASRVWLHTCTLDSPRALPSYLARGFRAAGTQRLEVEIEGTRVLSERILTAPPQLP